MGLTQPVVFDEFCSEIIGILHHRSFRRLGCHLSNGYTARGEIYRAMDVYYAAYISGLSKDGDD